MSTTDLLGLRYQASTDLPQGAALGEDLARDVEVHLVLNFASTAERSAKLATVPLFAGMLAWMRDVAAYEYYDGVRWVPWSPVIGGAFAESGSPYIVSGIGAGETNIPHLAVENKTVRANVMYELVGQIKANISVAPETYALRVRKDTPLTGTVCADIAWNSIFGGHDDSKAFRALWKCTSDDTDADFYVSMVRIGGVAGGGAGVGTASVYGVGASSFEVRHAGLHSGAGSKWVIS